MYSAKLHGNFTSAFWRYTRRSSLARSRYRHTLPPQFFSTGEKFSDVLFGEHLREREIIARVVGKLYETPPFTWGGIVRKVRSHVPLGNAKRITVLFHTAIAYWFPFLLGKSYKSFNDILALINLSICFVGRLRAYSNLKILHWFIEISITIFSALTEIEINFNKSERQREILFDIKITYTYMYNSIIAWHNNIIIFLNYTIHNFISKYACVILIFQVNIILKIILHIYLFFESIFHLEKKSWMPFNSSENENVYHRQL